MDIFCVSRMISLLIEISTLCSLSLVYAKAPACCSRIVDDDHESCQTACYQIHEQESPIQQMQLLLQAAEYCSPHKVEFWNCVNNSLPALEMMTTWEGKPCCDHAKRNYCRSACHSASSKMDILNRCSEQVELSLFKCIKEQKDNLHCCRRATSVSCGVVCKGIPLTTGISTRANRELLEQHCRPGNRWVEQCMLKQWQPQSGSSQSNLPCCEKATNSKCRSTCRNALKTIMSENDLMDELIKGCGDPQPTVPLWQCFLQQPPTKKKNESIISQDYPKLQCCSKATSSRCRQLCTQTYKTGLTYNSEFESSCSYLQPVSTVESNMHRCLTDVEQPCQLGCTGLKFCSNFNDRPTELFRSCTLEADNAARRTYQAWAKGEINLPQLRIPVKDITKCKPEMWKAIACALEIKPCSSEQSLINLCKEDCLYILTKCVDATKLSGDKTVPALCNALPSKSSVGACDSMDTYLLSSPHTMQAHQVHHPCNPDPCARGEICQLRRRKCKASHDCLPYVCHKACPLGQMSKVLVPQGTAVRLADPGTSEQEECHQVCVCNSHGKIAQCRRLLCLPRKPCTVGHEKYTYHGEQSLIRGTPCICQNGELLCARRKCQHNSPLYTGRPENCLAVYDRVCGANGKTYPNTCIAKCSGVITTSCSPNCNCPSGSRCFPRHQVCLNDLRERGCPQFECIPRDDQCNTHHHDPVCSTRQEEFTNLCLLLKHRHELAYRGHCQSNCSKVGVVCGYDGYSYSSQCAAWAARVSIDYFGDCRAFGNLTANDKVDRTASCQRVICPPLYPSNCHGITPAGGCCPICATQLGLLWDPRVMEAVARQQRQGVVSVTEVLTALSSHVSVAECDVFGHLSVYGELIVMVAPVVERPTLLQVKACETEAERLHNLIRLGSPNLSSYLVLSPLLPAMVEHSIIVLPVTLDPDTVEMTGGSNQSVQIWSSLYVYTLVFLFSLFMKKDLRL